MKHATRPSRVLSILTALALAAPPEALAAPADDPQALEAFEAGFNEGQAQFDRGEYLEAARTWLAAAANVRETTIHRDNRAAVYEYVVDAYARALENETRPEPLREAFAALDAYCEGFTRAYGTETPVSPKIAAARDEYRQRLAAVEAEKPKDSPPPPGPEPKPEAPQQEVKPPIADAPPPGERPWKGLAIGGGVLIGLGVGAGVLGAVGAARGRSLTREFDDPANMCSLQMPSPACQALLDRGERSDAMGIAGAVAGPILVGAGVALLVVGLKRRSAPRTSVAPRLGPGFVGLGLHGSF